MAARRRITAIVVLATALLLATTTGSRSAPIASPFTYRGVIEGSYGPPWSPADRVGTLQWMGRHGLNVYVHAPKNDPYGRARWRDPYPPGEQSEFAAEISVARSVGVAWVPDVSPGVPLIPPPSPPRSRDVCFSCPSDLGVLYRKLDPFFASGARTLMISFDDVQKISTHPEDVRRYGIGNGAYGRMNRDLLNAVYRHYAARDGTFRLLTVLAEYSGTADSPYLKAVRSDGGLDRGIDVFWTGIATLGATIVEGDASKYAALVGREKVLLWDNYPANDYTGNIIGRPVRLFLGPVEGRSPRLASAVSGVLANPMNEAVASRLALATLADYLADPAAYDPESSWRAAIADLAGGRPVVADAVAAFAENSRSSTLDRVESPVFTALSDGFRASIAAGPFWKDSEHALRVELGREHAASQVIATDVAELAAETAAFLARLSANTGVAETATSLLDAQRPALTASAVPAGNGMILVRGHAAPPDPARVLALLARLEAGEALALADYHEMHGDRLTPNVANPKTIFGLYVGQNRLDAYVAATRRDTAWFLPRLPLARRSVAVSVDGSPVALASDGSFAVLVAAGPVTVLAIDGAGGATGLQLAL